MKRSLAAALAAIAIAAVPVASMAHGDEADATIPVSSVPEAGQGDVYLDAETQAIWQESNDDPGLQTTSHTHGTGDDAITIPADTRLLPPA
ncbi:MAG TPA: hypothetical protein VGB52_09305 [Actinomycetota bacterium]